MNLSQLNHRWEKYKRKHGLVSQALLEEVRFDAPAGVEASFDLLEMLEGRYILHLSRPFPILRGDYTSFILDHEFTHFADFLTYPYPKPTLGDLKERDLREANINTASDKNIFGTYGEINLPEKPDIANPFEGDIGKKLFDYMNTYSEFHACQVALSGILPDMTRRQPFDVEKNIVPAPYRDVSVKNMLANCLRRAHAGYKEFRVMMLPQVFVVYFRQMMYLMGYLSHFGNDRAMLESTFDILEIGEQKENYYTLYEALKAKDYGRILEYTNRIYSESYLVFVKTFIKAHYNPNLYTEDELNQITPDNYDEFVETLANREGGRIWSGRVSPVFGVNNVNRAYDGVDPETVRRIVGKKYSMT